MNLLSKTPPKHFFRLWPHLLGVMVVSLILIGSFLNPPGLGDDATYWKIADRAFEGGLDVFNATGFHTLRWPVWGFSYVSMVLSGHGLHNYYLAPFVLLTLGSLFAFFLTWKFTAKISIAWLSSILFVMHPLLNSVSYRPMPDLSEGLFVGIAFWLCLLWISEDRPRPLHWMMGLVSGLTIGLAFSNRFTGILILPLLGATVLFMYPKRLARLLPVFLGFAIFWTAEALVFQSVTGDFFHSITANMGARGKKGTEAIALWEYPTRFLGGLWKVAHMEPFFLLAAIGGCVLFWKYGTKFHRGQVLWFVLLYLAYSCAIQSVNPIQPMLRDGPRFLSSLALPMSVLGAAGFVWGLQALIRRLPLKFQPTAPIWKPIAWVLLIVTLVCGTERTFTYWGYTKGMVEEISNLKPGSTVVTHEHMSSTAKMITGDAYDRVNWITGTDILTPGEVDFSVADYVMFCRKQMWLRRRKLLEVHAEPENNAFPEIFQTPWKDWTLSRTLLETGNSDYVFLKRRKPEDKPPVVFDKTNLPKELTQAGLTLPYTKTDKFDSRFWVEVDVPAEWRGKHVWFGIRGSSDFYAPLEGIYIEWFDADKNEIYEQSENLYFHKSPGLDILATQIPEGAVRATVRSKFNKKAKRFQLDDLIIYRQD